ncbi:MAG: NTP transferase domain-containing protein [Eubacteriales bacterium]|nr:NTP transferase domain-containing protein [Eubacteriales bacterium]
MKISYTGGIVAAASKRVAKPFLQVGAISTIRRIVITYQQAGVFPIVIITGNDNEEIRRHLSGYGAIFLKNPQDEDPQLFESVRIGLSFLKEKCERILFTPVNVPMFTPCTLKTLMKSTGSITIPTFEGRGGHPVMIHSRVVEDILQYEGEGGLKQALRRCKDCCRIPVEDSGIHISIHDEEGLEKRLKAHNLSLLHPSVQLQLEKEMPFFHTRLKLLLFLIHETHNMRLSCTYMGISYSKSWEMVKELERNLGFSVVERKRGGLDGGSTILTPRGTEFLMAYQRFEEDIRRFTQDSFQNQFISTKIL